MKETNSPTSKEKELWQNIKISMHLAECEIPNEGESTRDQFYHMRLSDFDSFEKEYGDTNEK